MDFGLYFTTIKKEKYNEVLEDPKKLARYVSFYQNQHKRNKNDSKKGLSNIITHRK